ncbi:MAG: ATP-binding cassette domain-containing protein [Firmicutes bacterium]|nr:ATP-binding cassette domain-containing protein [Bacillota bacterium]
MNDRQGPAAAGTAAPGELLNELLVEVRGVEKRFGGHRVLRGVDLALRAGRVHGLLGANGAGKTTLMRILTGELPADSGQVAVDGRTFPAAAWDARKARAWGIAIAHQEVPVFPNLRVYEHFALEPAGPGAERAPREAGGWRAAARRAAASALEEVFPGSGIAPEARVERLTLARRQMLEIALAASRPGLRLLVLDEPTAALGREEVERLGRLMERLRDRGVGVVLITHRLDEVFAFCDEITVLRDGEVVRRGPRDAFTRAALVEAMGGRTEAAEEAAPGEPAAPSPAPSRAGEEGRPLLIDFRPQGAAAGELSLQVRAGEIVGLSGLAGQGQTRLLRELLRHARQRGGAGGGRRVAWVSGDRRGSGIFALWSTLRNVTVGSLGGASWGPFVLPARERRLYGAWAERLAIRAAEPDEPVTSLSGGNQQKALIARALAAEPEILLLDDPTRGVDAATKQEFYRLLRGLAEQGKAVVWTSSDDDEMEVCDRVYVMREGRLVRELAGGEVTRANIVAASFAGSGAGQGGGAGGTGAPARAEGRDRPAAGALGGGRLRLRLGEAGWLLAAVAVLLVTAGIALVEPSALLPAGLPVLVSSFTPVLLAAASELMVIAVGDIDLGLGAYMGLVNALSATWLVQRPALGAAALLLAWLLYVAQGLVVALRRVPAIVVTLGASFVWLGVALVILPTPGGSAPAWLLAAGNASLPLLPEPLVVGGLAALANALLLFRTRLGVRLRAAGENADHLALRVGAVRAAVAARLAAYAAAGFWATLAGLAVTALTSSADALASQPATLLGIAAVIVGGGSFSGGRVEPAGAVLGALLFSLLEALLGLASVNVNYASLIEGLALVAVLALRLALGKEAEA